MQEIFEIIKATKFFKQYAPKVQNVSHKLRGKNGRGNPVEFSDQDKTEIKKGLKKFIVFLNKKS